MAIISGNLSQKNAEYTQFHSENEMLSREMQIFDQTNQKRGTPQEVGGSGIKLPI